VPNFFRKPYGPGWALVGDAGYNKDFITAQGIHDAFRDAELCVTALDEAFGGVRSFDAAMAGYQSRRDALVLPMYEFTTELATLEPPPPELQYLLAVMAGNQEAMDGFARVNGGVTSPEQLSARQMWKRSCLCRTRSAKARSTSARPHRHNDPPTMSAMSEPGIAQSAPRQHVVVVGADTTTVRLAEELVRLVSSWW
jgi:hypothetical protein